MNPENPPQNYLNGLNPAQRDAVMTTEGPLLIVAGAGAGKTKTLTSRILHLIKKGVAPHQILAITFTNKAAAEMRQRVMKLISTDADLNRPISFNEMPFVSTFHALGIHILRQHGALYGLPRNFTIFDRSDSKSAIKTALTEAGYDPKQYEPSRVLGAISKLKGNMFTLERFRNEMDGGGQLGKDFLKKVTLAVWEKYEAALRKEKALDFDDLLLKTAVLFKQHPDILAAYQEVWKYVHIDEYQDTNEVQYEISKQLAAKYRNICVVGDADQTIYTWRGADIKNILDFEKDYPEAKVVLLEENYRSTQTIIAVANSVISKNVHRKEKTLFTKNPEGERIGLYAAYNESDEADFIAEKAEKLIQGKGINGLGPTSPKEICVLYRANFQSRVLEEAFLRRNIPYLVLGTRFFERKEVKDVLSYIRAALNPDSMTDTKRIINVPARGIGKVTVLKIIAGQEESLPKPTRDKIANFRKILTNIRTSIETDKPSEAIKKAIELSGIDDATNDGTEDGAERIENLRELVTLATKYDFMPQLEGIEKLLEEAALMSDQDNLKEDSNGVRLMTVHAAKGLEFDYVFIAGLEADLFPHKGHAKPGDAEDRDNEEERRLFYVAVTRARIKLYLSYAHARTIFGSLQVNAPSEFLSDIPEVHFEDEKRAVSWAVKEIFMDF